MSKNGCGSRIRQLREHRGLSRDNLGSLVGVQAKQIGRYERGERHIDSERLRDIAAALAVPVAHLFEKPGELDGSDLAGAIDQQDVLRLTIAFGRITNRSNRQYLIWLAEKLASDPTLVPLGRE